VTTVALVLLAEEAGLGVGGVGEEAGGEAGENHEIL